MWPAIIGAAATLGAGYLGSKTSAENAEKNIAMQKEFAKNGIQWKVQDAQKAGVHPLYALGAQTHSFSPIQMGGNEFASSLASAGQDISRAVTNTQNQNSQHVLTYQQLQLDNMRLQNEHLQAQIEGSRIANLKQVQSQPGIPSATERFLLPGQSASGAITTKPMEITSTNPGRPHMEPAAISDVGLALTGTGGYAPVPSAAMKQRIEDDLISEVAWSIRNRLAPALGYNKTPPSIDPKPGYGWVYNPAMDQYEQRQKLLGEWLYW